MDDEQFARLLIEARAEAREARAEAREALKVAQEARAALDEARAEARKARAEASEARAALEETRAALEDAQQTIARQQRIIQATAQVASQAVMDAIALLRAQGKWSVSRPSIAHLLGLVQHLNDISTGSLLVTQVSKHDVRSENDPGRAGASGDLHGSFWHPDPAGLDRGGARCSAAGDQLGRDAWDAWDAWDAVTCPRLRSAALELYTMMGCMKATRV